MYELLMRIQTFTSSKWVGVFSTSYGAEFTARIHYTFRYFNIQCPNNCKGSNVKSNLCRDRVQNNWNLAIKLIYTMKYWKNLMVFITSVRQRKPQPIKSDAPLTKIYMYAEFTGLLIAWSSKYDQITDSASYFHITFIFRHS